MHKAINASPGPAPLPATSSPAPTTWFITGTDTHVGKTVIACYFLRKWQKQGKQVLGFKPIASGCQWAPKEGWRNEDAQQLQAASNITLPYALINPFAFPAAIAPHIAAHHAGTHLSIQKLQHAYDHLLSYRPDHILIEGAGGWDVPLNKTETFSDLAPALNIPVVLVVGLKLGCLNHSLLTYRAIQHKGAHCIGWVGNHIDPLMLCQRENIDTLQRRLPIPCLGIMAHGLPPTCMLVS